jgi:hypothetical protein
MSLDEWFTKSGTRDLGAVVDVIKAGRVTWKTAPKAWGPYISIRQILLQSLGTGDGQEEKWQSHPARIGTYKERIGTYNIPHLRSQGLPMETERANGSQGPFSAFQRRGCTERIGTYRFRTLLLRFNGRVARNV